MLRLTSSGDLTESGCVLKFTRGPFISIRGSRGVQLSRVTDFGSNLSEIPENRLEDGGSYMNGGSTRPMAREVSRAGV